MRTREYFKDSRNGDIWYKVFDPQRGKTWVYQLLADSTDDAVERSELELANMLARQGGVNSELRKEYVEKRIHRLQTKLSDRIDNIRRLHNVARQWGDYVEYDED